MSAPTIEPARLIAANQKARRGLATHIGTSITSGMIGKMMASKKLRTTR
jgi:hypothetical protein